MTFERNSFVDDVDIAPIQSIQSLVAANDAKFTDTSPSTSFRLMKTTTITCPPGARLEVTRIDAEIAIDITLGVGDAVSAIFGYTVTPSGQVEGAVIQDGARAYFASSQDCTLNNFSNVFTEPALTLGAPFNTDLVVRYYMRHTQPNLIGTALGAHCIRNARATYRQVQRANFIE